MKLSMDLYLALTNFDIKKFSYLMPELFNILKYSPKDRIQLDLESGRLEVDERLTVLTTAMYLQDDDRIEYIYDYKLVISELIKELNFDTMYPSFMEVRNTALTFIDETADLLKTVKRQIPSAYELSCPITPVQKEIKQRAVELYGTLPSVGVLNGITFIKEEVSEESVAFKGSCPISWYPEYKFDYTKTGLVLSEDNMQTLNLNLARLIEAPSVESLSSARSYFVKENEGVLSNAVNMIKGDFMDSLMAKTFSGKSQFQ